MGLLAGTLRITPATYCSLSAALWPCPLSSDQLVLGLLLHGVRLPKCHLPGCFNSWTPTLIPFFEPKYSLQKWIMYPIWILLLYRLFDYSAIMKWSEQHVIVIHDGLCLTSRSRRAVQLTIHTINAWLCERIVILIELILNLLSINTGYLQRSGWLSWFLLRNLECLHSCIV